jgi:alkanesulfonate monooxygenase SsuD/methylene tetrahydromethanopterin reductase-like flavin-dependent oxidoreductase (luciferase family)
MTQVIYGKDDAQMSAKLAARGTTAEDAIARGLLVGTRSALIDQIGAFAAAGVERFMLQWIDQDDIDGLERMARDLLPHFHKP